MKNSYKIGISTTADYSVNIFDQITTFSKCGFDFISIGARMEHSGFLAPAGFERIIDATLVSKLIIESVHFPFGREHDIASSDPRRRDSATDFLIDFCGKAMHHKIPIVILHPHHFPDDGKEFCLERALSSLEKVKRQKPSGVRIAIENLPGEESSWIFSRLMELLDAAAYGFCYDSSHENISGPPFHLLKAYHHRLTTCHLSDNRGKFDDHLIPGDGMIDWEGMRGYFDRCSNFGNLLLEVGTGEKLTEPLDIFAKKAKERSNKYFG